MKFFIVLVSVFISAQVHAQFGRFAHVPGFKELIESPNSVCAYDIPIARMTFGYPEGKGPKRDFCFSTVTCKSDGNIRTGTVIRPPVDGQCVEDALACHKSEYAK